MSRESEKLLQAIGQVADGQIEEAQTTRRRFPRWAAGLAAVFALAIALTVFFTGRGGNAYALVEASYPKKETGSRLAIPHSDELTPFIRAAVPRLLEGEEAERVLRKMEKSTGNAPGPWSEGAGAVTVWAAAD